MVASPSELSIDGKQPHSYSMLLKSIADNKMSSSCSAAQQPPFIVDHLQTQKLEEYLSRLEEERLKIDAFKRELPLCMQLLTNAMEVSRHQLQSYKATSATQGKRPILEEFIPIKHTNSEGSSDQQKPPNFTSDKANWMTSAQLWSQANEGVTTKQAASLATGKESDMGLDPKLSLLNISDNKSNQRNDGAFLPFTKERSSNPTNHILSDLALTSDEKEADDNKCLKNESEFASENSSLNGKGMDTATQTNVSGSTTASQRKQRRCWSPDLHRRFVNALQMLGGSQVATPKQIRELMKVDGLTNDEVKSHLQKYRLHTRRPGPNPQPAGAPGPHLVVLGGIWVPPEYSTAAATTAHHHVGQPHAIYSAHPAQHYFPQAIQQAEFYPPPLQQALPQLHHHPNHQIHIYKASPQRQSSPECDGSRGARDRSESIEDEKSGSSSWKGDSGEESNGERKRKKLASMREGEEGSNGSDITLKF